LEQLPDYSIRANQGEYVRAILSIEVGKLSQKLSSRSNHRKGLSNLRDLIGSLQHATTHTRPDVAAKLGEIQVRVQLSKPSVSICWKPIKVLKEAQQTEDVSICFRSISASDVTHVVFSDASFASPKQLASFQSTMVFATTAS
jgi:hypothetical protein